LAANNSMNDYISRAVKSYSSLFKLPSHRTLLIGLLATCVFSGTLMARFLQPSRYDWLRLGSALGLILFGLTMLSDALVHYAVLRTDPVFNFRRCSALSFYSLLAWLFFIILGVAFNLFYPGVWFKMLLIGFCVAFSLRLLVFSTVSFAGVWRVAALSLLLPVLYIVPLVYTASFLGALSLDASTLAFTFLSVIVTATAMFGFVLSIDRVGLDVLGVGAFSLLKAFMATWTEDQNAPFESLFEKWSQERDIKLSALLFRNLGGKMKAIVVVPAVHPGPFKNVGSSALPSAIQKALERKLLDCVVMVPHGLSGHDLDLANQNQNQLIIDRVLRLTETSDFEASANRFLRVKRSGASSACQVFNNCAFLALTLAPETMEDLPPELNTFIIAASKEKGFQDAIAVDAHNSIQGRFNIDHAIEPLKEAVLTSLDRASEEKSSRLQAGAAKLVPKEFSLGEGIGSGGITALVVKVVDQTAAYITIDGNNMVSGLRERILAALSEMGVDDSEVFTTDTHEVNAVVLNARGYHPVGEAVDEETLLKYVRLVTADALANLEEAEVAWHIDTVSGVRVIGERQIEAMCTLLDKAMKRAKKLALSVFPAVGVILTVLLLLL